MVAVDTVLLDAGAVEARSGRLVTRFDVWIGVDLGLNWGDKLGGRLGMRDWSE